MVKQGFGVGDKGHVVRAWLLDECCGLLITSHKVSKKSALISRFNLRAKDRVMDLSKQSNVRI